jgi:hypothetical protein
METREPTPTRHEHPCGHECECREAPADLCDRCELANVMIRRHRLGTMSRGEALARLYLAMSITAGEGRVRLDGAVVDDMIELQRGSGLLDG